MFDEISMISAKPLEEFMGFTEDEVKRLCHKHDMDFNEMKSWYDGYHIGDCSVYNPRSIVNSIIKKSCVNYWTSTENYEALKTYFDINMDGIVENMLSLIAGDKIIINPLKFQNDMTTFKSEDDIFTLLVHLGYLGFDSLTNEVYIPNKEIREEFENSLEDAHWQETDNIIKNSMDLLKATWNLDEEKVAYYIEEAHYEISHLKYNSEEALSYCISFAYFKARDYYRIERENPSGKGFADLVFKPKGDKPALLVELKWQDSPDTAINQIKEKNIIKV